MKVLVIQHVDFEGPAAIADYLLNIGHDLDYIRMYNNDTLPVLDSFDALVIMGGPMSIYDDTQFKWLAAERSFIKEAINGGKIVLGICLGAQFIADALGSKVYAGNGSEVGWFPLHTKAPSDWLQSSGVELNNLTVFHWHGDTFDIPVNCEHLAGSANYPHQAFIYDQRVLALQFHLEVTPQALDRMIVAGMHHNCSEPAIQSIEQIREGYKHIENCHKVLRKFLEELFTINS